MSKKKPPEGCDPRTGDDRSFLVNELGYEDEENDQEDWFAPFRSSEPPIMPDGSEQEGTGLIGDDDNRSGGDDLDGLMDEVGDCAETEPPKGRIIPSPERRQGPQKIIELASLSPRQVSGILGITEAQAIELLQLEAVALNFDDLREVDPATGVSMTFTTAQTFQGFKRQG